jgi:hypothetical protein
MDTWIQSSIYWSESSIFDHGFIQSDQLNVNGSLVVNGPIIPLYTTPTFSAGQIGYTIVALTGNNTVNNANETFTNATSLVAPAGVYIITAETIYQSTGAYACTVTINGIGIGITSGGIEIGKLIEYNTNGLYITTFGFNNRFIITSYTQTYLATAITNIYASFLIYHTQTGGTISVSITMKALHIA